jgi:MFS family permease
MQDLKRDGISYGWVIVAVATLALLISNGLSIGGIPVYYKFVQQDLVASGAVPEAQIQSVYGTAPALTFLLAGFLAPFAGFLVERLRPRLMMIIGCFILGAGLIVYSQASSAMMVYLSHALLGTSLGFVGVLVNTVLVSGWFSRNRGLALGIVLTGTSFGGVLVPQIATPLTAAYGWRFSMVAVSLVVWLVLLPAVVFLVKDAPALVAADTSAVSEGLPGYSLPQAIQTPFFWIFSLCAALVFYALFVVTQQLNLYLQSPKVGFSPSEAAGVQSLLFLLSIIGKFAYGFLADKFSAIRVLLISVTTMFLSTLAFLSLDDVTVYVFAALFGLNYGGTFVLLQLLIADYFGQKEYGKILGAITVIETMGGAAGTYITSRIADANSGDYQTAFLLLIGITAGTLVLGVVLNIIYKPLSRPTVE